ncbi:MAG TPA: permease prefix domain 1-containing protein, partial [Gammaproteobacteria bacterium]|nr:permease prefix domain 1-containing protein [Gammaproteobacteria bacterium]
MRDWQEIVRAQLASARLDPAREAEIVEELAQHLEDRYETLRARGLDDAEAERAVLAELSDAESLVRAIERSAGPTRGESAAAMPRMGNVFRDLWSDLRYAARTLRRSPWFAATAVLCLGLGIGATSTVFGAVDALFFQA